MPIPMLVRVECSQWGCIKATRRLCGIVGGASIICLAMTIFRAYVIWQSPLPLFSPAWYHSKACLYGFELGPELIVTAILFMIPTEFRSKLRTVRGSEATVL
jgi:hypothetical protein